jgi:hypothetical protein
VKIKTKAQLLLEKALKERGLEPGKKPSKKKPLKSRQSKK